MAFDTWVLYVMTVAAVCFTPGPNILLGMTLSIQHGLKASVVQATGAITATSAMAVVSATGLGAVLLASEQAFMVMKWIGGAYLFYLGFMMWMRKTPLYGDGTVEGTKRYSLKRIYFKGIMVSGSNPKGIIFFGALFPLFIDPNAPILAQFSVMLPTFMVFSWGSIVFYAALSAQFAPLLKRPHFAKWFNRVSGTIFMTIGLLLATSEEKAL